ncbi:hypothetical protein C2S52_017864 [Perilla frutescens var. hirtella]|nr:hypothetical protein C2S52_017864 [Perilla frutescens var. hirtella]
MGCIKLSLLRRNRKFLQVVKVDGKVMEFTTPLLVKELLINFEGFGVKSSRKYCKVLPPCFELQLGKTYYLFPKNQAAADGAVSTAAVKRIKVVITKKQLEELLSKKTSVENIIFGIDKAFTTDLATMSSSWKPNLVAIPEENEFINM